MVFCYVNHVNHVDNLLISHPQCNEFICFILTAEEFFSKINLLNLARYRISLV